MARDRIRDIGLRRAALIRSLRLTLSLDSCSVLGRRQLIVFSEDSYQILRHSCPSNELKIPCAPFVNLLASTLEEGYFDAILFRSARRLW